MKRSNSEARRAEVTPAPTARVVQAAVLEEEDDDDLVEHARADNEFIDNNSFTTPLEQQANSIWLYIVPRGMRSLVNYVKNRYNSPPIYITEDGMDDSNNPFIALKDALKDTKRIKYHNDYLTNLAASIKEDGCDVRDYFAWSLLDNWEWAAGYSSRFGLYFVDYNDKLKRYPKSSVSGSRASSPPAEVELLVVGLCSLILINNAGSNPYSYKPLVETSDEALM
ncbi:hypothetical protein ZWY2020_029668 [Hordeum vulgare]|nr:hypothetical protein ZWY2020_029668 [Hordeum vulgare]